MIYHISHTQPDTNVISQAVLQLQQGKVAIYPTDSLYAMGAILPNYEALITSLSKVDRHKDFSQLSLLVDSFEMAREYALISTPIYREMRAQKQPTTWLLPACSQKFKKMKLPKRQSVGIRLCQHPVVLEIIRSCQLPLVSASLEERDPEYWHYADPEEIQHRFNHCVDLILLAGFASGEPSEVIDRTG